MLLKMSFSVDEGGLHSPALNGLHLAPPPKGLQFTSYTRLRCLWAETFSPGKENCKLTLTKKTKKKTVQALSSETNRENKTLAPRL